MIRLLTEAYRAAVLALLSGEPQLNLYMLGNLEKLGFNQEFCQFWGDVVTDAAGEIAVRGVVNRYMNGWAVYGRANADWAGLAAILATHPIKAARLQDNPGGIPSFLPFLRRYTCERLVVGELMDLSPATLCPVAAPVGVAVRRGARKDLAALVAFYAHAEGMTRPPQAVARPLQDTRLWLAEQDGQILSTALTNAETQHLAMIGGVFTRPAARGRGLSQAVCSALCQDLFAAGCQPVLYWGEPVAGAVYHKLGFRPIGQWRAVWLKFVTDNPQLDQRIAQGGTGAAQA